MISDGASSERRELCLVGRPNLGNRNVLALIFAALLLLLGMWLK